MDRREVKVAESIFKIEEIKAESDKCLEGIDPIRSTTSKRFATSSVSGGHKRGGICGSLVIPGEVFPLQLQKVHPPQSCKRARQGAP
ncbi:hypothetical protein R5R35_004676 [Gryllus longicercus]|uniref:Uncharacterized protein n=1 Tax=Gryllus longicercus TaxID=2509291 RepID=A0AAN9W0X0_9ORTH